MSKSVKKKSSVLLALLLAVMLTAAMMPGTAFASGKAMAPDVQAAYEATGKWLVENVTNPVVSSTGGEWAILGLARAGYPVPEGYYEKYYQNVVKEAQNNVPSNGNNKLHSRKATENQRVVLALTALGYDVRDVGGYDLLQPLGDLNYDVWQGINGAIFALIALDTYKYDVPELYDGGGAQASRENIIEKVLGLKVSGGGWALFGSTADPDITFMAVQALAPYYDSNEQVKEAVDEALTVMSAKQNENGAFGSWGTNSNAESAAQAIVALTALGIDPEEDTRFIKGDNSLIDGMMGFYVEGGGFGHTSNDLVNGMATEQCYYALAAYDRFLKGKNSLYDMTDVVMLKDRIDVKSAMEEVASAQSGATVEVAAGTATILPGEMLKAAKGRDVNIVIDMGDYSWTVNGADITADEPHDVSLQVIIKDTEKELADKAAAIAGDNKTKELSLIYSGDFGFKGTLTVNLDAANAGKTANLFYYNGDKELEFVCASEIGESGDCSLQFTHASDYVVVMADEVLDGSGDTDDGGKDPADGTNTEGQGADGTDGSGSGSGTGPDSSDGSGSGAQSGDENAGGTGVSSGSGTLNEETASAEAGGADDDADGNVPRTGDATAAGAWLLLAALGASGCAALKYGRKSRA